MVQKSLDYLIWYENELDYQKAASYFANSPYGIIYVKNKRSEAISGIITIGEVVNGMCEERLSYKSSFVYASSADEAIKLIENNLLPATNCHQSLHITSDIFQQIASDKLVSKSCQNEVF